MSRNPRSLAVLVQAGKRVSVLLFILFMVIVCGSGSARKLIIAGVPGAPMRYYDESGNLKGIDVDIIDYVMKELGIDYQIMLESSSPRYELGWKSGAYDMVLTYSFKEDRAKYLIYSNESHVSLTWNFFIRKEDKEKIHYNSLEDLRGLIIGATQGYSYTKEFWDAYEEGLLQFDVIVQNRLQLPKLILGRIDAIALNRLIGLYEAKSGGFLDDIAYLETPLKTDTYYNAFVKASTYPNMDALIERYDGVIRKMKDEGIIDAIIHAYIY